MEEKSIKVDCKLSESGTFKAQIYCSSIGHVQTVNPQGWSDYHTVAYVKVEGIPYRVNRTESTSPQWEMQDIGHICRVERFNQKYSKSIERYNRLFGVNNWETIWLKENPLDDNGFTGLEDYNSLLSQ